MDTSVCVVIDHLRVVRGSIEAIRDCSTSIRRGEITGLLGPSGCGKTTLMRSIVGVQIVTGGSVTVLGEPAGSPPLRRSVGYLTQAPSVYDDLSIDENLAFFAAVLGVGNSAIDRAVRIVGLDGDRSSLVGRMSGGERSRVSLAIALLAEPDLLVLDEPTVGLDPVLRKSIWETFRALANAGKGIVVSSHVMDEAMRCDRLLLMRAGTLIADDEPRALMDRTGTDDIESAFLALVSKEYSA